MDQQQARQRLLAERAEVEVLLRDTEAEGEQDRTAEDDQPADSVDPIGEPDLHRFRTVQQIEQHLISRNYEGFAGPRGPKIRGRVRMAA